jgi:hypothetical protein
MIRQLAGKLMKSIFTGFSVMGAFALLALAVGCEIVNPSVVKAWEDCQSGKRVTARYTAQPDFLVATSSLRSKNRWGPDQVEVSQV